MINVSELLWLHNMGVPDEQIQALYNKEETPADPAADQAAAQAAAAKQEPAVKQEPAAKQAPAPAPAPDPTPAPAPDPTAAVKQDPTSAALLEVIKSLQAQNAQLAAGKQPEGAQSVEDMLLSLI